MSCAGLYMARVKLQFEYRGQQQRVLQPKIQTYFSFILYGRLSDLAQMFGCRPCTLPTTPLSPCGRVRSKLTEQHNANVCLYILLNLSILSDA